MKALYIAGAALLRLGRDRRALTMIVLLPLVLIGILGAALGGLIGGERPPLERFPVAVFNGDDGGLGDLLVNDVLQGDLGESLLDVRHYDSADAVSAVVQREEAYAGVIVPARFTAAIFQGDRVTVQVLGHSRRELHAGIVRSVVDAFVDQTNAIRAVPPGADEAVMLSVLAQQPPPIAHVPPGPKPVSAYQYYAVGMAVMNCLFTAVGRGRDFLLQRQERQLQRLFISPTGRGTVVFGQFLAAVAIVYGQFLAIMGGTRLVYGVSWGESIWPALLLAFAYSVAAAGISMIVAGFVGSTQAADQIGNVGVNLLAALGGSQVPVYIFPPVLRSLARWTPNGRTLQAMTDIMSGRLDGLGGTVLGLIGFGLALSALAAVRLQTAREV